MTRKAAGSPPPHPAHRDRDRDRDWGGERERGRDRRARSRDRTPQARWPHTGHPRGRPPQRDPSPPELETPAPTPGREHRLRGPGPPPQDADAVSYQDVVALAGDRKPQNPIQDNMENYRKLLSLGVQLAENDGHSHLTHGHPSRSWRSAHPSTSRGLKAVPDAKKPAHRRGICEDESSHGVIMEKFLKDVSRSPRPGRARECSGRPPGPPRWPDQDRSGLPPPPREPLTRARGLGGHALAGGFPFHASLVSKRRALERKRRYHLDADGQGAPHDQGGCPRKRPAACGEVRKSASSSSLGAPASAGPQPPDPSALPHVCDECGRCFRVVSGLVEHQILHTRESLDEYGESFTHSVAVSQAQKRRAAARSERKGWGCASGESTGPAERRRAHVREPPAERQDGEREEPFVPGPPFGELQRVFGPDKFYECQVCRESFLHSSALADHQKAHGKGPLPDGREEGRGDAFRPSPTLSELQKMHGKDRVYACKVCGEAFPHGSSLREHRQAHARGKPSDGQGQPYEETFVPGQKRRQKTHSKEKFYDCQDGGEAFRPSPDPGERPKTPSWKTLYEGRGWGHELPGAPSGACADSQRSHTIARAPEDGEGERAFVTSARPAPAQTGPVNGSAPERKPRALPGPPGLPSADGQRSHSAGGPRRLDVLDEPCGQSTAAMAPPSGCPGESGPGGEACERPVVLHLAALQCPQSRGGAEPVQKDGEKAGASAGPPGPRGERQEALGGESPSAGVAREAPTEPQEGLAGEAGGSEKDRASPAPDSQVRGHQKARAKKKNIEQGGHGAPEAQPLRPGAPRTSRPRERAHECRACGASFALGAELAAHHKTHGPKPAGGGSGLAVPRGVAPALPQTSYALEPELRAGPAEPAPQPAAGECRECGARFASLEGLRAHQKVYAGEKIHARRLFGNPGVQGAGRAGPPREEPPRGEPGQQAGAGQEGGEDGEGEDDEDGDSIYGCGDCGLGFADRADLRDHRKVHSREYPVGAREPARTEPRGPRVSEYQRDHAGEQLYECPACGESFLHSSFLFEHQKVHEQDPFYGFRRLDEPFLQPLILQPRRPRAPRRAPRAGTSLECQVCGQDFVHASLLMEHMRVHPGASLPDAGQPSEDAAGPGLALTELQRSQTEEKQHECKMCGEAFLSRAALREHTKTHKRGEPYEYGASFVHTSFLTEPPRRGLPFYECKDCGESFIHNTVLTKHQKLHLEEEAATAAQEAEANVLVPREVLRIRGSGVQAAQPEVEAAEPDGEAGGPDGEAAEPDREAEQPHTGDADEPDGAGIEDPEESAEEPEGDADEPDGAEFHDPEEAGDPEVVPGGEPCQGRGEPGETAPPQAAWGPPLTAQVGVVVLEPRKVSGEGSRSSAGAGDRDGAGSGGRFRCDVCGQLFCDRLDLARHQDAHTG
ncbi:paternally-expressed gene 3 protein [Talpa occidentalis]|uniref:paternally-expressed gene 3 protein n=1 Tax=Talpa occidentalis TaxID=50954 RepID=UPI00188E4158|nr:paternally-expressed gene 3 protein [Talpa occidentalis]XP_037373126.1 paternally-expressed gene 3 protein [Talpa occidentalis]XP_037373127.1 paternally-expressed gene 3 protein [Talpa occidentalis]XP_054553366.1 paternally-expressed gene 3 protein [Talpa occidentalis]XP_054553367.1 paternally-expressed gene 3 protein [Talpa occidentalis]